MNFLHEKALLAELEQYILKVISFPDFEIKKEFLREFISIKTKIEEIIFYPDMWSEKYEACLKVQAFFRKGMGSKWEFVPSSLSENIQSLSEQTNNYLRLCYKNMGNEVHDIDTSELFAIGDKVSLRQGELLSLSNFGRREYVDIVTAHIYIVEKILSHKPPAEPEA